MNGTQIFALVTGMLSGLSLFMFGMNVMSDTLTQLAGGKLSGVIDKITANRFASKSRDHGNSVAAQFELAGRLLLAAASETVFLYAFFGNRRRSVPDVCERRKTEVDRYDRRRLFRHDDRYGYDE